MSIEIKTEKTLARGEKMRKILSIKMLREQELPVEYCEDGKCVWLVAFDNKRIQRIEFQDNSSGVYLLTNEELISETRFQEALARIKSCGERLREINKKLAEKNHGWAGDETFVL